MGAAEIVLLLHTRKIKHAQVSTLGSVWPPNVTTDMLSIRGGPGRYILSSIGPIYEMLAQWSGIRADRTSVNGSEHI